MASSCFVSLTVFALLLATLENSSAQDSIFNSSSLSNNRRGRDILQLKHMAAHGHDLKHKNKKGGKHAHHDSSEAGGEEEEALDGGHDGEEVNEGESSHGGAMKPSAVGADTNVEDLRHAGMNSWKKKKKELRLALKASGGAGKQMGAAGTTLKEFAELEREVHKGGRMANVPCSPPHCTFRCATDRPCKTHPLLDKWREPEPRVCGQHGSVTIWPISFGIPESEVVDCVPLKATDFATVVPYRESSYVFGPADEAEYKRDYRKALFGFTRKKEGWDCMRHYEILASGTVPMFLDIDKAPEGVMTHLPKDLLSFVRNKPYFDVKGCEMRHPIGECSFSLDHSLFNPQEYESVACSLLQHTKEHLTTKSLAAYALRSAGLALGSSQAAKKLASSTDPTSTKAALPRNFRALYLGGTAHNSDYLRDTMLHGFRDLLGGMLYEYNTPRYMFDWPSDVPSNGAVQNPNKHWGMGFSISRRLHYTPDNHLRNQSGAVDLITSRFFDVVIYGNAHRGLPLWYAVQKAKYEKEQVIVFNGEDWHGWKQVEAQQEEFGILDRATYFLRELPDGCPELGSSTSKKKKGTSAMTEPEFD